MSKPLLRQKTFWSALLLIASQALPAFGVPPGTVHIIQVTIGALTAIFLRQGINL
jgi:hypothetical protein